MSTILFESYVRGPKVDGESATTLAGQLDTASPDDLGPEARKQLRLVTRAAADVASVVSERERVAPARVKPVMIQVTRAWLGLHGSLTAKGELPADVSESAPRAAEIAGALFPDGVAFATADATALHGASTRMLARVHDEGLERDIDHLVGREFLATIRKTTQQLGEALGARGEKRTAPSTSARSEALARFGRAIGAYCRALMAETDVEDDASVARFVSAVAPIDAYRAASRGAASGEGQPQPTTPASTPAPASTTTTTSSGTTSAGTSPGQVQAA